MMKSFFKKLAFVMALAMVVSLAAPAGTAFAANELIITKQDAKSKAEEITGLTLKAGEEQDLKFWGAPSNYKSLAPAWSSSNKAVATVDQNGLVKAVAAGTATITYALNNGMTGTVKVTVPAPVVAEPTKAPVTNKAFTVKQTSVNSAVLTFNVPATGVTVDTLEIIWLIADLEVNLTAKNVIVDGNVVNVVMNDNFADGNTYIFRYDGKDVQYTMSAGTLSRVGFSWYTDDEETGAGKAYVSTDDELATTVLVPHFYDEKGVDITALYDTNDFEITYTLATEDEDYDLVDNELTFNAISQAVVNMTVTWQDDEGEDKTLYGVNAIVGVKRPAVELSVVKGGFMLEDKYPMDDDVQVDCLTDFKTNPDSLLWSKNMFTNTWTIGDEIADDGSYMDVQAAAIVKDNRGNVLVTGIEQGEAEEGKYPYGYFTFASSKETVLGVGEDGLLAFYEPGKANVLIYFVPADAEDEDAERVLIGAIKVTVKAERYAETYKMINDMSNAPVASVKTAEKDEDDNFIYEANEIGKTSDVVLQVYDQYGAPYVIDESAITVEAKSNTNEVEAVAGEACWCSSYGYEAHYHISASADDFVPQVKGSSSKSFKYTVTVDTDTYDKITTKNDSFTYKVTNVAKYWNQLSKDLDGTDTSLETYYISGVTNKTVSVDLAVKNVSNWANMWATDTTKSKSISLKYLSSSNGLTLANVPSDNIIELVEDQTTGLAGVVYYANTSSKKLAPYMDLDPANGKLVVSWPELTTDTENGDYADGFFKFAPTGSYKVTLYTAKEDGAKLSAKTYTYTVKNSNSNVVFAGYDKELGNETEIDISEEISDAEIREIIEENLVFTLEGLKLDLAADAEIKLVDVLGYELGAVTEKSVTIRNVTFGVRVDDGSDDTDDQYICAKVRVGRTIREK